MAAMQRFLAILVADLRERTRSVRFWVVLGIVIAATWACFPSVDAGYVTVSLSGGERGKYSSAWIGLALALQFCTFLSLGGFYLVRGTLVRDIETRVWQLLVATPMTRGGYLLAKWLSHMTVFGVIMAVGLLVGLVAQMTRAEDTAINLFELIKPVLLLSIPSLAITAMLAVWFDLLPWLRRTAGNVLFFILWVVMISVPASQLNAPTAAKDAEHAWVGDPSGVVVMARELHRSLQPQTSKPQAYGFSGGVRMIKKAPVLLEWKSWQVRPMDALGRLLWLAVALAGVLLAAPWLDRAAARGTAAARAGSGAGRRLVLLDRLLTPFARGLFGTLVIAELRLVLRQRTNAWWLIALVLCGVQVFGTQAAMLVALPLAWLLPLDVLARGVLRDRDSGTEALIFTAPGITWRLLAARAVVAIVLAVALAFPGLLRLIATHPWAALAALAITASISLWGLALGALCRNPRPFELIFVAAVYSGLQGAAIFDLSRDPITTAAWHALALLPALLVLVWAWPRLARR